MSKTLANASAQAICELKRLIGFGRQSKKKLEENRDPVPTTPTEAVKYAAIRLKAACRVLDAIKEMGEFKHLFNGEQDREEELEQLRTIANLPAAERKQAFAEAAKREGLSGEEVKELRLAVERFGDGAEDNG